jgi:hypothetical protein
MTNRKAARGRRLRRLIRGRRFNPAKPPKKRAHLAQEVAIVAPQIMEEPSAVSYGIGTPTTDC